MAHSETPTPPFGVRSFRTTASHTIGVPHLIDLLRAVPADASEAQYREAVVDQNVLGRPTHAGRQRSFRHLRELYLLDPAHLEFAALRHLWDLEPSARPLLAGILAFTRDGLLRASFSAVAAAVPGDAVTSADLSRAAAIEQGTGLSEATLGKVGRNTGACWTQTGHLHGRARKVRTHVEAAPAAIAYAAYLGHAAGRRGLDVLATPWAALLDVAPQEHLVALRRAHQRGLLDLQVAGNVVEVGFSLLDGSR